MRLYQLTAGTTTRLGYDNLDRIAEYDGSNAILRRYIHGPGIDEPILWYEGSGITNRRFLSSDQQGSIIALTDSAGALVGINRYDEYGMPQSTNLGSFGYTGQASLPQPSIWYYKSRNLLSELGKFGQTDTIGYADSPNLYAYVLNDPVNRRDPQGTCSPANADGANSCLSLWFRLNAFLTPSRSKCVAIRGGIVLYGTKELISLTRKAARRTPITAMIVGGAAAQSGSRVILGLAVTMAAVYAVDELTDGALSSAAGDALGCS